MEKKQNPAQQIRAEDVGDSFVELRLLSQRREELVPIAKKILDIFEGRIFANKIIANRAGDGYRLYAYIKIGDGFGDG